ncbi:MAG: glycoside hydrolase family 16 protein [Armatimonadaceae bacterium]|jgi:beta-glucanase (GH16 family)
MVFRFLRWLVVGILMLSAGVVSAQRPAQGPMSRTVFEPGAHGYRLVWEDEFPGTALDRSKWKPRSLGPRGPAFVSEEAIEVRDGYLWLWAKKDASGRMLSSAVGTMDTFQPRYGYFECRAQVQKSAGVWSAFWIQSKDIAKGEDPAVYGAEIDIMECFRKLGPDIVSHNVHWAYGPNQKSTRGMQSTLKGLSTGFHTFGLEWTPDKYVFFVDGMPFYEVKIGISRIPEYLILSMEYPNNPEELARTLFPDVFVVDWVRVWQKP